MAIVEKRDYLGNRVNDSTDIVCAADRLAIAHSLFMVEELLDKARQLLFAITEEADESGYVYEQLTDAAQLLDASISDGLDVAIRILEEALETS